MARGTFPAMAGAAALSALVAVTPGRASAETLTDALIMAYRNSHLLEQNRAVLRAADENVALSVATLRPVINFVASGETVTPATPSTYYNNLYGTLALSATMTIYDFGRTRNAIEAAKQTVLATRAALVGVEQQVLLNAVRAYLNVRRDSQAVALQQSNVRVLSQELKATKDKFDVGEVTKTDVAQAEAVLAASRAGLEAARGTLAVSREAFKAATGAYPSHLAPPPGAPATAPSLSAAESIAQRVHPSILQARYQLGAADYNAKRAAAATNPNLTANLKSGIDNKGNTGSSLGITFTQPIYYGGQLSAAYRQAAANRDQAKAGLMQAAVTVSQNLGSAWSQLQVADASIIANQQQVRAAQVAFNGVREEAKFGSRTTLDVLNAEQSLLNARLSLLTARTNRDIAEYSLLAAMGLMTAEHLKLGVPVFDPTAYYNAVKNAPAALSPQGRALDRILKTIEPQK